MQITTIGFLYSAVSSQALLGLLDLMSVAVPRVLASLRNRPIGPSTMGSEE